MTKPTMFYAIHETQDEDTENSGPFALFDTYDKAEQVMKRYQREYPQHDYRIVSLELNLDPGL